MYTSPFGVVVDPGAAFTTASAMNRSAPPNRQPAFANASTGATTVKINHRRHMGNSPRGMFGRRPNDETLTAEQSSVTHSVDARGDESVQPMCRGRTQPGFSLGYIQLRRRRAVQRS